MQPWEEQCSGHESPDRTIMENYGGQLISLPFPGDGHSHIKTFVQTQLLSVTSYLKREVISCRDSLTPISASTAHLPCWFRAC